MNGKTLLEEIEKELATLKEQNSEAHKSSLSTIYQERQIRIQEEQKKKAAELHQHLQQYSLRMEELSYIINTFFSTGELLHIQSEISKKLNPSGKDYHEPYTELDDAWRERLFETVKKIITEQEFFPFEMDFSCDIFVHPDEKLTKETIQCLMPHFKDIITVLYKGYLLKNDVSHYIEDAFPAFFSVLGETSPARFFEIRHFAFPHTFVNKKQVPAFKKAAKKWFNANWKPFVDIEKVIVTCVEQQEFKNARRTLFCYDYFLDEDVLSFHKNTLVSQLEKEFLETKTEEDSVKRESRIRDIQRELLHFF